MGCSTMEVNDIKEDEILIEYKLDKNQNDVQIFWNIFVINNKDKCKIIIEGKEYELEQKYKLTKCNKKNNLLKIKIKGNNNITNNSLINVQN